MISNEIREEIAVLRDPNRCAFENDPIETADLLEKLLFALEKIIIHGVWDECIHCNAKVKIAELATAQTIPDRHSDRYSDDSRHVSHSPGCSYWKQDWRRQWGDEDCTCGLTAGEGQNACIACGCIGEHEDGCKQAPAKQGLDNDG